MDVAFPYRIDGRGRTASPEPDRHLRDLIEQVLFTTPGERVNRPDFGSGLLQSVFAPTDDALAAATQAAVRGALQRWLGDRIEVTAVEVTSRDSTLRVVVQYRDARSGEQRTVELRRAV